MLNEPLWQQHCRRPADGLARLEATNIPLLLPRLTGWEHRDKWLVKTLHFNDYAQTSAFVNAVIWLARQQDHHPQICFGYRDCHIELTTHAVDGLSLNDFILAARIDHLQD